jgi:hypothetical protein
MALFIVSMIIIELSLWGVYAYYKGRGGIKSAFIRNRGVE